MLPALDIDGQEKLWNSRVLIIGIGGLGCAAAQYLTASGIGLLTLVDDDCVDETNLQRQVLHGESHVGLNKCVSAKKSLSEINSEICIATIERRLEEVELAEQVRQHDVILDCSDNLVTRNLLNKVCFAEKTPLISGAAIRMEGQIITFLMDDVSSCYQCLSHLFGEQTLSCSEAGILSPVVGIVGCIQATEVIKVASNIGKPLSNRLMLIDAMTMDVRCFDITKNSSCSVCSMG